LFKKKPVLFLNTNSFIQFSESLPVIAFEFPAIARRFGRFLCQRTCYFFLMGSGKRGLPKFELFGKTLLFGYFIKKILMLKSNCFQSIYKTIDRSNFQNMSKALL